MFGTKGFVVCCCCCCITQAYDRKKEKISNLSTIYSSASSINYSNCSISFKLAHPPIMDKTDMTNEIDVPNQQRFKTKCRTKNPVDGKVSASSSFMKEGPYLQWDQPIINQQKSTPCWRTDGCSVAYFDLFGCILGGNEPSNVEDLIGRSPQLLLVG